VEYFRGLRSPPLLGILRESFPCDWVISFRPLLSVVSKGLPTDGLTCHLDVGFPGQCYDRDLGIMGWPSPTSNNMRGSVEHLSGLIILP
jgi:hypothetical protein